tara:strand:- start:239 stop:433 length:195 start_codon:yes stop_codon:yes gene_type:complete
MENETEYQLIEKAISKQNRKEVIKLILGGALVGIVGAVSLVMFLNMLVLFDWLSDSIVNLLSGV